MHFFDPALILLDETEIRDNLGCLLGLLLLLNGQVDLLYYPIASVGNLAWSLTKNEEEYQCLFAYSMRIC